MTMKYIPKYDCDLHTHTNRSDGNDTYKELIDLSSDIGMKVIAIVDHDVEPLDAVESNGAVIPLKQYAESKNMHVIPGIEFSCDTMVDEVHIIGLGCDFSNILIKNAIAEMKQSKIIGYQKLTELLCENDMNVTWDYVLFNDGSPIKSEGVQRKHIFEAIARAGYTKTWSDAKIMVKQTPALFVRRPKLDPIKAIDAIHKSGGISIMAHPYLIASEPLLNGSKVTRSEYIDHLIDEGRLMGIEAAYNYSKTSYEGDMTEDDIESEVKNLYSDRMNIISGGSDYHNDGKKGVKNQRMIGEKGISFDDFMANEYLNRMSTLGNFSCL